MKYLKSFNESLFSVRKEGIEKICKKYEIENYTINDDLTVDINGDLFMTNIDKINNTLVLPLNFNKVSGNCNIGYSSLISLKGCPQYVGGDFFCNENELETLEFGPKYVGGNYSVCNNKLKTLDFLPDTYKELDISDNLITNVTSDQIAHINLEYNEGIGTNPFDIFIQILYTSFYLNEEFIKSKFMDLVDKLEEFEVIKDHTIDMISLNSLFDYYNKPFTLTKSKLISKYNKIGYYHSPPIIFEDNYKII